MDEANWTVVIVWGLMSIGIGLVVFTCYFTHIFQC
jgi:hypothetical protein